MKINLENLYEDIKIKLRHSAKEIWKFVFKASCQRRPVLISV